MYISSQYCDDHVSNRFDKRIRTLLFAHRRQRAVAGEQARFVGKAVNLGADAVAERLGAGPAAGQPHGCAANRPPQMAVAAGLGVR